MIKSLESRPTNITVKQPPYKSRLKQRQCLLQRRYKSPTEDKPVYGSQSNFSNIPVTIMRIPISIRMNHHKPKGKDGFTQIVMDDVEQ